MIYPSEKMGGNSAGGIRENKKSYLARISTPKTDPDKGEKTFEFDKNDEDDKKRAFNEANNWLYEKSKKYDMITNMYKYIDKDTIEVDTKNGTFFMDAKNIDKIKGYTLGIKDKKDSESSYVYYVYSVEKELHENYNDSDEENSKKKKTSLTRALTKLIFGDVNIKFVDGNTLNLRSSNIMVTGIVPLEFVNNDKNYNIDHYEHMTTLSFLSDKNYCGVTNILPRECWTLGKFKISDNLIKKSSEKIIVSARSKITQKEYEKTISVNDYDGVNSAQYVAESVKYNMMYRLGLLPNMIRIVDDEIMYVMLSKGMFTITDTITIPLIQKTALYTNDNTTNSYCIASIGNINISFHFLITNNTNITHINGNKLDNRLINLRFRETGEGSSKIKFGNDKNGDGYYSVHTSKYRDVAMKKFYLNNFGSNTAKTKQIAEKFMNNMFEIDVSTETLEFTGYENLEDYTFLLENLNIAKQSILSNLELDVNIFMKNVNISNKQKSKIQNKWITINLWRTQNLDRKIQKVREKMGMSTKNILSVKLPYSTQFTVLNHMDCKITYDDVSTDKDIFKNFSLEEHKMAPEKQKFFDAFIKIVTDKGGKVLDDEYFGAQIPIKCICGYGHEFMCTPNNLQIGRWCSTCNIKQSEFYMCKIVEYLFPEQVFKKIRPNWLKNKEGNNLELDLFCEELSLAFEYNGVQHYEFIKHFHKTEENFNKRIEDDKTKIKLCKSNDIVLIIIPYTVLPDKMYDFIVNELLEHKVKFKNPNKLLDINSLKLNNKQMESIEEIVKEKKGTIVDGVYVTRDSEITIKCEKGHEWTTRMAKILSGSWCHTCGEVVDDIRANKISEGMKKFNESEKGKELKKKAHEKRSATMAQKAATITHKVCVRCKTNKLVSEFTKRSKDKPNSYQSNCKACFIEIKKERRLEGKSN